MLVALGRCDLQPSHTGASRIGAVSRSRNDADISLLLAIVLVVRLDGAEASVFAYAYIYVSVCVCGGIISESVSVCGREGVRE
jgi:hypothetical protein